jgi:hypothetical protein
METLLQRGDNGATSPPAPAQGLYFVAVTYPPELFHRAEGELRAAVLAG